MLLRQCAYEGKPTLLLYYILKLLLKVWATYSESLHQSISKCCKDCEEKIIL